MAGDILIWIMIVARIVIGVSLTRAASRQNVRNLFLLAAVFYIYALSNVFYTQTLYNAFLFTGGAMLAQVFQVLFINQTFYRDRPSPWKIFMAITLLAGLGILWFNMSKSTERNSIALVSIVIACNWLWHTVIAGQAYRAAAPDRTVEDWIKTRYRLMIAYCSISVLAGALGVIVALQEMPAMAIQIPIGLISIGSIVLQYLVWVMPEGFRQYSNRNYQVPVQATRDIADLSEEEIMEQLQGGGA